MREETESSGATLDEPRLIEDSGLARRIGRVADPVLRDLGMRLVRVKVSAAQARRCRSWPSASMGR